MANEAANVIIAANGRVAIAPQGTALPTDATAALDPAFTELGYISEDGVEITPQLTTGEITAWQSLSPVRTFMTAYGLEVAFTLMEWIETNLKLAFGGGVFTDNLDGTWDFQLPAPGEREQYVMVIEGQDGNETYRWVLEKVELSDTGGTSFKGDDASMFPVTVKTLAGVGGRPGSIYGDTNE